jgi:hypothetical protein
MMADGCWFVDVFPGNKVNAAFQRDRIFSAMCRVMCDASRRQSGRHQYRSRVTKKRFYDDVCLRFYITIGCSLKASVMARHLLSVKTVGRGDETRCGFMYKLARKKDAEAST